MRHRPYWIMCYIMYYLSDLCLIVSGSTSSFSISPSIFPYPNIHLPLIPRIPPPTSAAVFPALIPRISIAGCSHHRLDILSPSFRSTARHNYMIGQVAIYFAAVFWWQSIYTLISSSPTVSRAAPMGGYTHVPSRLHSGPMPDIRRTARWWKPSMAFSRRGFNTHISEPNRNTACTTVT